MIGSQYMYFTVHWFVLQRNTWLVTPVDHPTLSYRKTQEFSSSSVSRVDQDVPSLALNPDSRPSQERERPYEQRRHDCNHHLSDRTFRSFILPVVNAVFVVCLKANMKGTSRISSCELNFVYDLYIKCIYNCFMIMSGVILANCLYHYKNKSSTGIHCNKCKNYWFRL